MLLSIFFFFNLLFPMPVEQSSDVPKSIYDFKVPGLTGGTIDFSKFKGKKILIVNTASECGYTPQFEELEKLSKKYEGKLVVVGFPSNDFGSQDPGSNEEIAAFCKKNYGVTFPMAEKVSVKGDDAAPIYKWLTNEDYNKSKTSTVKWNFQKYLINENGELVEMFATRVKPLSDEVIEAVEKPLEQ